MDERKHETIAIILLLTLIVFFIIAYTLPIPDQVIYSFFPVWGLFTLFFAYFYKRTNVFLGIALTILIGILLYGAFFTAYEIPVLQRIVLYDNLYIRNNISKIISSLIIAAILWVFRVPRN